MRIAGGDQAQAVQQAIEGYHQFQDLTERYAQAIIDQTRAELAAHSKKELSPPPQILLAQEREIQQLIAAFRSATPQGPQDMIPEGSQRALASLRDG
ncbi:MAG: hypothetical protein M1608_18250 [Candidatus Omnitrophica bacterium]|nr:hypothetical protein [Candidatus Omnitrophota bacterium]